MLIMLSANIAISYIWTNRISVMYRINGMSAYYTLMNYVNLYFTYIDTVIIYKPVITEHLINIWKQQTGKMETQPSLFEKYISQYILYTYTCMRKKIVIYFHIKSVVTKIYFIEMAKNFIVTTRKVLLS